MVATSANGGGRRRATLWRCRRSKARLRTLVNDHEQARDDYGSESAGSNPAGRALKVPGHRSCDVPGLCSCLGSFPARYGLPLSADASGLRDDPEGSHQERSPGMTGSPRRSSSFGPDPGGDVAALAYTFGGVEPVGRSGRGRWSRPGRWTASPAGSARPTTCRQVCDPLHQPADRPVLRRGRGAGRHPRRPLRRRSSRRATGRRQHDVPLFGALTATHTTAMLHEPLPERAWMYEIDRRGRLVRFRALDSASTVDLPLDPMHGTVGVAPAWARSARRSPRALGRQHGHAGDAGRRRLLPRRQRGGRAVQPR